ncbi:DMT family transporter [Mesobacterium pallidum]|uniref:DMT family transporter n=1 Tax=Mesobacterium pallidum TaxID=2872037 RepID=UPI001EE2D6D4|nr:DMT family transporter [Mesobacterium pallidum]
MTTPAGRPALGILFILGATFLLALSDVATKTLTMRYPVPIVGAGRYGISLLLLLILLYPRHRARLWHTNRSWLVLVRALALTAGSLCMGLALRHMPVGETVAIFFLAPFGVLLLSAPLLGEKVSLPGWIAASLGFAGILLIVRPGNGLDPVGVVFALLNALAITVYFLLTRLLSRTETTEAMLFHVTLVGAVAFAVMALAGGSGPMPGLADWGLIALLGGLATGGHFLMTAAYREAPPSLLAPINYVHIVWATAFGWLFFAHVPDRYSLVGMGMVSVAGAGLALWTHRQGRRARRAAALAAARTPEAP